jgi:hypothetical protein
MVSANRKRRKASAKRVVASSTPRTWPDAAPDRRPSDVVQAPARKPPSAARELIRTAIGQLDDEDGWVPLGGVGQRLAVLASDFDPRTYGQAKLRDLVDKAGGFDIRRNEGGGVYIRVKPPVGKSPPS